MINRTVHKMGFTVYHLICTKKNMYRVVSASLLAKKGYQPLSSTLSYKYGMDDITKEALGSDRRGGYKSDDEAIDTFHTTMRILNELA